MIYQFARQADDLADEGDKSLSEKLNALEEYQLSLSKCIKGEYDSDFWEALHNTVSEFSIDSRLLFDLLDAFKQDLVKNRFQNFNEILAYCEKSANPVGRIVLSIYGFKNSELYFLSDKICSALQLTNFYQDTSLDLMKDRIYYPADEMEKFSVTVSDLMKKEFNENIRKLISFQVNRTYKLFQEGKPLIRNLPYNLKIQIKATIYGGLKILSKIKQIDFNVINFRVKLSKFDALCIILKALR